MADDGLRQRKSVPAKPAAGAGTTPSTRTVKIDTSDGHLGLTMSDCKKVAGCEIDALHAADLCAKAGLKVGDVVTKVNGKAVTTHHEAFALINMTDGELCFEYMPKAAVKKAVREQSMKKWRVLATVCKGFAAMLVAFLFVSPLLYHYAPQELFMDHVDTHVLPHLGYEAPMPGYDGKPRKRVVRSKDPTKPWKVPGWNRAKENDAIARIKENSMIKIMCRDHMEDLMQCDGVRARLPAAPSLACCAHAPPRRRQRRHPDAHGHATQSRPARLARRRSG